MNMNLSKFMLIFGFSFLVFVFHTARIAYAEAPEMPKADFEELTETSGGTVTAIIDPKTILLDDGRLVEMTGLDFPDLDYYSTGNFSVMTLKILKDFLLNQNVMLYQTKDPKNGRMNRMGHAIAHLIRKDDKTWVQGLMLSLGLARVRTTKANPEMAAQMYALEDTARVANKGVWAVKAYQVIPADDSAAYTGSYQIIEGKVEKAAMQKNKLFLNFGNNWRTDFTIALTATNRKIFEKQGIDPQNWGGRKMRVRGWVESYNGAYIEIDHPQQVQLLGSTPAQAAPEANPEETNAAASAKETPDADVIEKPKKTILRRGSALPE